MTPPALCTVPASQRPHRRATAPLSGLPGHAANISRSVHTRAIHNLVSELLDVLVRGLERKKKK